ncbi:MAG TPA: carboxypeptidase regulatory-like domain-containing protein [Pyrinomonadaceae bacterium]|nr:carboxypeptidase regulatory-like domain-containing protein [Pyrinomonadaceae bacterium]
MRQFAPRSFVWCLAVLVGLLFTAGVAVAQVTTGNLQGIVQDPNKAIVTGATVKVTNTETGIAKETTTNDEGFYRVTNLTPGEHYKVEVTAQGFAPSAKDNIVVRLGTENTADIELGVSGATANVTVTADTPLIDSAQSQLSTNYTPQQLTQLPFVGAIDNLALLTPGVITPGDTDFANGVGISANGNRGRSNNFQIDGQDNNDNSVAGPSLSITNAEAIGDFQVITNSFSAEFGRNSGAQINVVTRSGTNEFHGALFEFHQNSALNARDNLEKKAAARFGFLASNGFPQFQGLATRFSDGPGPDHNNRFGGRIGGPIVKNKAFFFATYEGNYDRGEAVGEGLTSFTYSPTAEGVANLNRIFGTAATNTLLALSPATAQHAGVWSCAPPVEDSNGDGLPDTFQFSTAGTAGINTPGNLAPLAVVADPTAPGGRRVIFGCEDVRTVASQSTQHQFIGRVDWNLTSKDTLQTRYIYDNSKFPLIGGRFLGGFFYDEPSKNNNLGVTYTRNISSKTVNEGRFNFSRLQVDFGDVKGAVPGTNNPGPGIAWAGTRSLASGFTGGILTSFGALNNIPQNRVVDVYQFQDTVAQTIGNHALKYGADIRHQKVDNFFLPNFTGQYRFNSGGAALPANTFFNYGTTGLNGSARTSPTAFENFILGRPDRITFALGNPQIKTTQNDFFFFIQDDWRIRPTLTLNLGLRYEISTTPFNPIIDQVTERESNASTAIFNTAFPLAFRTTNTLPIDKNNFGPRVGFAWSPNLGFGGNRFRDGKTVIRGGFGVAYDPPYFNIVLNTVTAAPFAGVGTLTQTPGGVGSVNFPFLPQTTAALNGTPGTNGGDPRLFNQTRVDPNLYNPYTMSFNFGIQQEVGRRSVLEARYVGSRIVGQFQTVNGNPSLRTLLMAGDYFGNSTMFTHGILPGTCTGATCQTPTSGNGWQSRTTDATGARILGSGRVDPNYGLVRTRTNGATSTYNGLQVRFDTRFTNDLTLNANYTWSKTLDNASEIFSTLGGGSTVAQSQDPFNTTSGERGLSAFDQRHNFTTNFLYTLPFMKDQHGWTGNLLGGWEVGGLIRIGSGRAYTPNTFYGMYDTGWEGGFIGAGALRPFNGNSTAPNGTIAFGYGAACDVLFGGPECDYNGGAAGPGSFIVYNTANVGSNGTVVSASQVRDRARLIYNDFGMFSNFGEPLAFLEAFNLFKSPFGNVGRNTFLGEPFALANLSLFKTFKVTENTKLEFRTEAFNILNHRNFGVPDVVTEDAAKQFGGTFQNPGFNNGGNRSLRFGLRFIF